jgi:hypothetical protein
VGEAEGPLAYGLAAQEAATFVPCAGAEVEAGVVGWAEVATVLGAQRVDEAARYSPEERTGDGHPCMSAVVLVLVHTDIRRFASYPAAWLAGYRWEA